MNEPACHRLLSRSGSDKHRVRHEKGQRVRQFMLSPCLAFRVSSARQCARACVQNISLVFFLLLKSASAERANSKLEAVTIFLLFPLLTLAETNGGRWAPQLPVKRKKTVEQFLATHEENL